MSYFERIAPDDVFMKLLFSRLKECRDELKHIECAKQDAPQGRLLIHHEQYYLVLPGAKPRYLRKSEVALVKALAQKSYDSVLEVRLKAEVPLLEKLIALNRSRPVRALWALMKPVRRELIMPATLSDALYADRWRAIRYKRLGFKRGDTAYWYASRSDSARRAVRMRSKSELLIAALLDECGIPFRYEYPLVVDMGGSKKQVRPDFYCLEPVTRTEFVWEHFGLMDDAAYRVRNEEKLEDYLFSGPCADKFLLLATFEEEGHPFDVGKARKKLVEFVSALRTRAMS